MRYFLRALLVSIGLVVFLILAVSLYIWLRVSSLKSELAQSLQHALNAEVTISSLTLDPWQGQFVASDVTLVNLDPSKPWQKVVVQQGEAHFNYTDLFDRQIPLTVHLMHWNLTLKSGDSGNITPPVPTSAPSAGPAADSGHAPKIVITDISADTGHLEYVFSPTDSAVLEGVIVKAEPNSSHQWSGTATADSVKMLSLKANSFLAYDFSSAFTLADDSVQLSNVDCRCHPGEVSGRATCWFGDKPGIESDLNFVQISLEPLLPAAWDGKVNGIASGHVIFSDRDSQVTAHGHVLVEQTIFNLFPVISTLTHWLQTSDLGSLSLDHAETSFTYTDAGLTLSDLDLQKAQILAVTGQVQVDPQYNLDGHVQLGVPTSLTSKWPALQDQVFNVDRNGSHWAEVHVTGTVNLPQEDLSPRLEKLATDQGKGVLNDTAGKALNWLNSWLSK